MTTSVYWTVCLRFGQLTLANSILTSLRKVINFSIDEYCTPF